MKGREKQRETEKKKRKLKQVKRTRGWR